MQCWTTQLEANHQLISDSELHRGRHRVQQRKMDPLRTRPPWQHLATGYVWKWGIPPNYSHLVGIMIINHWVIGYTIFRQTQLVKQLQHYRPLLESKSGSCDTKRPGSQCLCCLWERLNQPLQDQRSVEATHHPHCCFQSCSTELHQITRFSLSLINWLMLSNH